MTTAIEQLSLLEMYVNLNLPLWLRQAEPPPCPQGRDPVDWVKYVEAERTNAVDKLVKEYMFKLGKGWLPTELIDPASVRELSGGVPVRVPNLPTYMAKQAAVLLQALRDRNLLYLMDWRTVFRLELATAQNWNGHVVFLQAAVDDATRILALAGEQEGEPRACDCSTYLLNGPERPWAAVTLNAPRGFGQCPGRRGAWAGYGVETVDQMWFQFAIYRHNILCCPPCLPIPQPAGEAAGNMWLQILGKTGAHASIRVQERGYV